MSDRALKESSQFEGLSDSGALPSGGGLVDKVGGPRNAALLAAVAVVGSLGLLNFRKKKAAAASPTPMQSAPANTGAGFDSTPYDLWNAWQSEYDALQGQVSDLRGQIPKPPAIWGGNPPTAGPPAPIPVPIQAPPPPTPAPTPAPPPPTPQPQNPGTQWVDVHEGDSFSSIASRYGHSWQELWNYQLQPGIRPPETQQTLRDRLARYGWGGVLHNGSSVAVPGDWRSQ